MYQLGIFFKLLALQACEKDAEHQKEAKEISIFRIIVQVRLVLVLLFFSGNVTLYFCDLLHAGLKLVFVFQ